MQQREWLAQAQIWLMELPGGDLADDRRRRWREFEEHSMPVVTIFGPYDTGKSSLIRRLLVDDGVAVPPWLAVSAKPETERTREIETLGCLIRDTPGISSRPDPLRGSAHNRESFSAIGLTDAALVLLNPQLALEEIDALRAVVDLDWPLGALILVVGRFDEAGVSPEDDPDAYLRLAKRKEEELRASLGLAQEVPVLFASQDPFQTAGNLRQPDPDMWDEFRAWDGMDAVAGALRSIGRAGPSPYRPASERRYWEMVLRQSRAELDEQLVEYRAAWESAGQVLKRRDSWMGQLDGIDEAAKSAAEGEVQEAVRFALASHSDADTVKEQIRSALGLWWRRHVSALSDLSRDVGESMERQHQRPAWDFLESLVIRMDDGDRSTDVGGGARPKYDTFAANLIAAMAKYRATAAVSPVEFAGAQKAGRGAVSVGNELTKSLDRARGAKQPVKKGIDFDGAIAAAPEAAAAVGQIVDYVDGWRRAKAAQKASLEQAVRTQEEVDRLSRTAVREAMPEWNALVGETRQRIDLATAVAVETHAGLDALVPQIEASVKRADALLNALVNG